MRKIKAEGVMYLLVFLLLFIAPSQAVLITWSDAQLNDDKIFIAKDLFLLPGYKQLGRNISMYKNITDLSLDERCRKGLPLTISWHPHEPYSGIHPKGSQGYLAWGIFPNVLKLMTQFCCANNSIYIGKLLKSVRQAEEHFEQNSYDFTFPVYGENWDSTTYKDMPFVPIVRAPRVILMIFEGAQRTKTHALMKTILRAWPMLIFILISACLAGLIIWLLDHAANPDEFPISFMNGAWEGFWWAFVTMTTVGYGDRAPKSLLGRVFCIMWIIVGISIISIFTAIITAALAASTRPHFIIHGSTIGAVNGSEEFKLGVNLNAEMVAFNLVSQMTSALKNKTLQGVLVDNYAVTRFSKLMHEEPIRIERQFEHPITFGMALPSNAPKTVECVRRFVRNHPQEMFEVISKHLKPLKNPTDDISYEFKAAERLFYQEGVFDTIVKTGVGVVALFLIAGAIWEFTIRRPSQRKRNLSNANKNGLDLLATDDKIASECIDELIQEYQKFHKAWMTRLKKLKELPSAIRRDRAYSEMVQNDNEPLQNNIQDGGGFCMTQNSLS